MSLEIFLGLWLLFYIIIVCLLLFTLKYHRYKIAWPLRTFIEIMIQFSTTW